MGHVVSLRQRALPRGRVRASHNDAVAGQGGTPDGARGGARRGARRAAKPSRTLQPRLLLLGAAAGVALVVWALLVWVAIDAGRSARGGDSGGWVVLALASLGAVGCLFGSLLLLTVLLRRVGILAERRPHRH